MLKRFSIKNFRLFRSLQVSSLGQVNLLVGKNNTGKSAFLEAVQIFTFEPSLLMLSDLLALREEWREVEGDEEAGGAVRRLFFGHRLPALGEEGIILESEGRRDRLHLCTAAYRSHFDEEEGLRRQTRVEPTEADLLDPEIEISLVAEFGGRTKRLNRAIPLRRFLPARRGDRKEAVLVPARGIPTSEVAALWDRVGLTPLEEEVIRGLKMIDESIEAIAFVEDQQSGSGLRIPLARASTFSEPVPLNSMGDGVSRLFHITLALVSAKDGILLVDEFENGLHWSIQPQVWSTVFKLAARLNVQVFATTHSRDCVEAFYSAWSDNPDRGAFYRLSLGREGEVFPVPYDLETLGDAVASKVEVR